MNYDFTTVIERKGTDDLMHEALLPRWHRDDLYPMWVADMGFAVCPDIVEAMRERLEHPIFGYTMEPRDFKPSIIDWVKGHHQWNIQEEWISYIPGIVKGIAFACNVFLKDDEKVVVMPPVYHPFFLIPRFNNKEVVWNPLKMQGDGRFRIDFENLATVCDEKCKLLILCNPHNPCGVCWTKDELVKLADFCHERGIIVISDEIHCDMALFGNKHIPFATVSEKAADISITFQAPSKTFNIAGIVSSYAVIPNATIRKRYFSWLHGTELNEAHLFAYIATTAAYRKGEAWRRQMIHAIEENVLFVEKYFAEKIPGIRPIRPQASFLVWLDCRELHLTHNELIDLFVDKARLALNDGEMFGPGGQGFMRMNIGSPKAYIEKGLRQLEAAVRTMKQAKQ